MAEETRGLGYPATSDDGFALVEGDDTPPEDDFLLLDTPGTSIAGDRDEAESKEQLTNLLLASDYTLRSQTNCAPRHFWTASWSR